ncbi:alpha/beta hydrolase [Dactylosporangium sp. NPDC049742]|uniref:alpha/beta hydrolase n=1 Tax=Dactylosporangium sp. NPDC049742 TaxID=3154737 RepID=UPI00341443B4
MLLVHGAFADASLWSAVVAQLREAGVAVRAAENPLRRLDVDAAHVADAMRGIVGPVLLAGHGYGGAVITSAATQADNAVGLVYVTGYALDAGESVYDMNRRFPQTAMPAALGVDGRGAPLSIDPEAFADAFAADLPAPVAASMAASQRGIAPEGLTGRVAGAAWRALPSWYLIAADDRLVHPQAQRYMAHRAGAHTSQTAARTR